jgi:hypothetical protein
MTRRTRRSLGAIVGVLAAVAAIAVGAASVGAKPAGKADSSTVYAATTHTVGGIQYVAGNGTDKLFGADAVTYTVKVASIPTKPGTFTLTVKPVTIWSATGSLTGTSQSTLKVGAKAAVTTTGTINLTKGTGAMKGHSFTGTVTGTGSLSTGQYVFHDKGIYK